MAKQNSWDGILEEGENIIWQGQPETSVQFRDLRAPFLVLFILTAAFLQPVREMLKGQIGLQGYLTFGLIFSVVAGILGLWLYTLFWERKRVWYTLTDRRAIIASISFFWGRQLNTYWLNPTRYIYLTNFDTPPSVIFEKTTVLKGDSKKEIEIGFKRIKDANKVLAMMKECQSNWNNLTS